MFQLELHRAECEFLTGEPSIAAERLEILRSRTDDTLELAMVACLGIDVYMTLAQIDRAVAICLDYLHRLGIECPVHPTKEQVRREYERVWLQLGSRAIEELVDFPLMSDPASIATLDVLTKGLVPALFTNINFRHLMTYRAVSLSIERGNHDGSCLNYVWISVTAGHGFGDYNNAFRLGQLGYELVEKRGLRRFQAAAYNGFASAMMPWMKPLSACCNVIRQAFEAGNRLGDLTNAAYSLLCWNAPLIQAGRQADPRSLAPLAEQLGRSPR
jgi:predicted ATPase